MSIRRGPALAFNPRRRSAQSAADAFYALMNEEVFQLLTSDCGWDVERFQRWATSLMLHQLVGSPDHE